MKHKNSQNKKMKRKKTAQCELCNEKYSKEEMFFQDNELIYLVCVDKLEHDAAPNAKGICCPDINCDFNRNNPETVLDHAKALHHKKTQDCGKTNCFTMLKPKDMKRHLKKGHLKNYFKFKTTWCQTGGNSP